MPAPRATWKGFLKVALVSCPVKLFPAVTQADEIHFHNLNPETHNRIALKPHDPETGEEVAKEDLVKGYEFEKGQFVLVDKAELDAVKVQSTKTVEIETFVDRAEVDVIYYDRPYFMVPDGKLAEQAYVVVAEAMRRTDTVGIGRVVMQARERLVALAPREEGLLMNLLRAKDEVADEKAFFEEIGDGKIDPEMIELAGVIIDKKEGELEPETFVERYQEELRRLIEAKRTGESFAPPKVTTAKIIDLKEALRQSAAEGEPKKPAARKAASPRKAATRRRKRKV